MDLKLKSGHHILIDDEDFERVSQYRWGMYPSCRYVTATINGKTTSIHRFVMNAEQGQYVDHINGDRLDNRKSNLRFCSHRANTQNRKLNKNSTTGIKGVCKLKNGRYRAKIGNNGDRLNLGVWETERDATIAYNVGAKLLYGEFANLNNLPPLTLWNTRPIEDALRAENEQLRADNARMREALEAIEMHTNEYIDKGANYPEYLDEIIKTIKALKGGE